MGNLEGTGLLATATLGADIIGTPATFTLSNMAASWPTSGLVHVNISDTETISGTISGTTVTVVTRAVEAIGAFSTAQNHTAGDAVKLIFSYAAAKNMFPSWIDQKSGAAASYTFSAIPQDGGDLEITGVLRGNSATNGQDFLQIQYNGDVGANQYAGERFNALNATGTAQDRASGTQTECGIVQGGGTAASWASSGRILIPRYADTTFFKSWTSRWASGTGFGAGLRNIDEFTGYWNSTAAITSIKVFPNTGSLVAGSILTLRRLPG